MEVKNFQNWTTNNAGGINMPDFRIIFSPQIDFIDFLYLWSFSRAAISEVDEDWKSKKQQQQSYFLNYTNK